MLTCQRDLFSLPDDLHYLNGAYMSPLSKAVEAAGLRGMAQKAVPSRIRPDDFFSQSDLARERFATLVNAAPQRVAIIPAASYGLSTVARNLSPEPGPHIVILHEQFPSNVYPWRGFRERGVHLTTVAPSGTGARGRHAASSGTKTFWKPSLRIPRSWPWDMCTGRMAPVLISKPLANGLATWERR